MNDPAINKFLFKMRNFGSVCFKCLDVIFQR